MSSFKVEVTPVLSVENHPNADRLSIVKVKGYICISAKLEDGSHRYKVGDLVVYIPEASVLPEWLLKEMDFWDEKNNKGFLAGTDGNRVKALRLRGIFSQGVLFPVRATSDEDPYHLLFGENGVRIFVDSGNDVAEFLGITKYDPPIPDGFEGDVVSAFGHIYKYDFESIQSYPDMFSENDDVVVTEKIHGINTQIGYDVLLKDAELFHDGSMYVTSKGMGGQGFAFKNSESNKDNVYVRMMNQLLEEGLGPRLVHLSHSLMTKPVQVFGEIFGRGIQDLHYGCDKPTFLVFDIRVDGEFVDFDTMVEYATELGLGVVPVLYRGKYDLEAITSVRDGKDTLSGTNVREGGVVKTVRTSHGLYGRKIGKLVSPDYILRKNGTEYN